MYNTVIDNRSTTALRDAMVALMKDRSFNDITIAALCRKAGVSRVTFYKYFQTPVNLLEFLCDSLLKEASECIKDIDSTDRDWLMRNLLEYLMKHADLLDSIHNSHRIDIFQRSFSRYSEWIFPTAGLEIGPDSAEYIKSALAAIFASLIFVWAGRGKKETPEDLMLILKQAAVLM